MEVVERLLVQVQRVEQGGVVGPPWVITKAWVKYCRLATNPRTTLNRIAGLIIGSVT